MKVSIIDYIGYSDSDQQPVGHPLKVIREFASLISDKIEVEVIAPQNYLDRLRSFSGIKLPLYINAIKSGKNTLENLKCMFISFINIYFAMKKSTAEVIWFCNVDQFLFMYLGIFGFHGKKVIVTLFAKEYHKWYHNYYMRKVLPHLSLIIGSNPDTTHGHPNECYIPDYLYRSEQYSKYRSEDKQSKVVCVGTMNRSKQIKELVEVFNEIDYPLEICGLFYENDYYEEIMEIKKPHISITNQYIGYDEYLQLLGEARYVILPYKQEAYEKFTSGVILESVFVGTIPITCKMLLDKMQLRGISYLQLSDLKRHSLCEQENEEILRENDDIVKHKYHAIIYQDLLTEKINRLGRGSATT